MSDKNEVHLAFIGCGVMAESMIAGLLRNDLVPAANIIATHPRADRREELRSKYGIQVSASNAEGAEATAKHANSAIALCVKPQRLKGVLDEISGVAHSGQLVISIVAGASIASLAEAIGT